MDETNQSAETAHSAITKIEDEPATLTWGKGLIPFSKLGGTVDTSRSLILMCFKRDLSDSEPTEIPQPYLYKYGSPSQVVAQATQAIRTHGGPQTLSLLDTAWLLRIQTQIAQLPSPWATAFFASEPKETVVVMQAKLNVQQPSKQEMRANYSVQNAWLAVAPLEHEEAISAFLHTVLAQVLKHTRH